MGLFSRLVSKVAAKPQPQTSQPQIPPAAAPSAPVPARPLSIDELEQQMAIEAKAVQAQMYQPVIQPAKRLRRLGQRLIWTTVLVGIPIGAIALINLPYAPIRRPIAQKAPFLLMPSYISMDQNFRQGVANVETAKQLIDAATAPADLELGEQKLKQAQANFDRLPTWLWSELPDTRSWWWYGWRMNALGLNSARAEIGRLQGKVFQEKNAQIAFIEAEQTLKLAIQQHQEAQTPLEKQAAMRVWQDALDQMQQIPMGTLASKMAAPKLAATQRDFEALGGLAVGNQQAAKLIAAAKEFGHQAAQAGQNPPHSVTEWERVIGLWKVAINRLGEVPVTDSSYPQAQKLMAQYSANLEEIQVRKQAEAEAVIALKQANDRIANLLATSATAERSVIASQLQQIISQLETIENGTTAHGEAQQLLKSATDRLKQLK